MEPARPDCSKPCTPRQPPLQLFESQPWENFPEEEATLTMATKHRSSSRSRSSSKKGSSSSSRKRSSGRKKSSSRRKYSPSAGSDVKREMHEFKRGKLKSGSGKKVKSRKQAIAIGLSEA